MSGDDADRNAVPVFLCAIICAGIIGYMIYMGGLEAVVRR